MSSFSLALEYLWVCETKQHFPSIFLYLILHVHLKGENCGAQSAVKCSVHYKYKKCCEALHKLKSDENIHIIRVVSLDLCSVVSKVMLG